MPHITALTWDENDQVRSADLGGGGDVYYEYDAAGQRVRKVWEHSGLVDERIYLGGYEVYRRRDSSGLSLERQTLHVMDGARRVAMVETKTVDTSGPFTVTPRVRYQLDNHLGSASLEVDGAGLVIGYEEYHPYGTTSYWSAASGIEVSQRRYRYTGKEKDEETGLYYHGARYYAPWLGRWTSADPAGMIDGSNLYVYCRNAPSVLSDPSGRQSSNPDEWGVVQFKHPVLNGQFARIHDEPVVIDSGGDAVVSKKPPVASSGTPAWLRGYMRGQGSAPDWLVAANAEYEAEGALETILELEGTTTQSSSASGEEGVWSFLEGAALGGFSENDSWSTTAGSVAVGLIPIVGQIADIRDFVAAAGSVAKGEPGAFLGLGAAAIGIIPGFDWIKGATRAATRAGKEVAEEAVEKGVKKFADDVDISMPASARQVKIGARQLDDVVASSARLHGDGSVSEALRKLQRRQGDPKRMGLFDSIATTEEAAQGAVREILQNSTSRQFGRMKLSGYVGEKGIVFFDDAGRGVLVRASDSQFITFIEGPRGLSGVFH
ncbi:RHS repeat-associated core domain-containing protein [Sorangium cellulosum]|uniref:RHS repeat-associated core domain-containing protein n=1 Tax=Sorangium cellulosum TaxID=56 RepID=UPI001651AE68|nr:RHS repeat-associated core domain-containing protein [Sorangium cellulosum]